MFLPLVTYNRSPTTFAPVVRPMSCLIEPRYSTLSDETQSGPVWLAAASGVASRPRARAAAAGRAKRIRAPTQPAAQACASQRRDAQHERSDRKRLDRQRCRKVGRVPVADVRGD